MRVPEKRGILGDPIAAIVALCQRMRGNRCHIIAIVVRRIDVATAYLIAFEEQENLRGSIGGGRGGQRSVQANKEGQQKGEDRPSHRSLAHLADESWPAPYTRIPAA